MRSNRNVFFLILLFFHGSDLPAVPYVSDTCPTQEPVDKDPWQPINVAIQHISLRGLAVYDDEIVWASGTAGTMIRSYDQGRTWRVEQIKGAEELDFRDLSVIDPDTVVAMTSGTPARVYRTSNRGDSWELVYESLDPKVFLDSISFLDPHFGLIMGDPVDGALFLLQTLDGGKTWSQVENTPKLEPGEAGFAASGTNMTTFGKDRILIALGGGLENQPPAFSRILLTDRRLSKWHFATTPIPRSESAGIFSIVMIDELLGLAVGGDYRQPELAKGHVAMTLDGGKTWRNPQSRELPTGYRSCVGLGNRINGQTVLLAVGTNGTDQSLDLGKTWQKVSNLGLNSVRFSPSGKVGWGVGSGGTVVRWKAD